jgi:hypothetical protein
LAGFQVTIIGRIWVTTEALRNVPGGKRFACRGVAKGVDLRSDKQRPKRLNAQHKHYKTKQTKIDVDKFEEIKYISKQFAVS